MTVREWNSAAYHSLSDPQFGWGMNVLRRLEQEYLRGNEHILDAGCGSGRITAELLKSFPRVRVTAVDASKNMVDGARQTLLPFGERVTTQQLDLLELSAEQEFDIIFSTAVFHWIKDHDRLFRNLFHALRPGGLLLAQCGGGPNLKRLRERTQQVMALPEFAPYFKDWQRVWEYPDPETTLERLKRPGFIKIDTGLEIAPTQLPDAETFRQFQATVTLHPYLERLPQELHHRFLDPIVEQFSQDKPPFLLDYWRLNIYARKP
ncbi:MAG: methyltransferase type 11 [Candidatus Angelobacter sp. Gp1-AA117]|nr:MAG: methyltransferase type 11 [Candidatus Angelobacter sp. Gp1-AA117]